MDSLSDWSRIHVIIATCFVAVNCLIVVPWRKSLKVMFPITAASIFLIAALSSYTYFFTGFSTTFLLRIFDVVWFLLVFVFAKYRDSRTLYFLLSAWMFCIAGGSIAIAATHYIPYLWMRILISLIIHSILTVCLAFFVRDPYHRFMELGRKGWLFGCVIVGLPLIVLRFISVSPVPLSKNEKSMPLAVLASLAALLLYMLFSRITDYILKQRLKKSNFEAVSVHSVHIEERLQEAALREKQNAILRHDLRHFAGVISGCIKEKNYDEALLSVQGLLQHPAMLNSEMRYCKNPIINALMNSFNQRASGAGVSFDAVIALGESLCVDTMDLAVMLSNLLENAMNACEKNPSDFNRSVKAKLYMAGEQLFISVSNTFEGKVEISRETGLPVATQSSPEHGIGLLSVQTFLEKYRAQVDCVQKDEWFQVRIIASAPKPEKEKSKLSKRYKLTYFKVNAIICSLVIGGFLVAGASAWYSFNKLFKTDIESVSRLTSETIHANINSLMTLPINVSLTMSRDTLLRELVQREHSDGPETVEATIQEYLSSYQTKYGFDSVALTSVKTGAYYHYDKGVARYMSRDNAEDEWYYEFLNEADECKLNIDMDKVKNYSVTIFSDSKLFDEEGNVIGIVGIGMKTPYIQELIQESENIHGLKAFLIDKSGEVQLSSDMTAFEDVNLFEIPVFSGIKEAIINEKSTLDQRWYSDGNVDGYIITKYIPSLNWYLVIEKDTLELRNTMLHQLISGSLFMIGVVVVIMVLSASILTRFYKVLAGKAEKDSLTGLRNRESFEQEMQVYGGRLGDYSHFGLGVFSMSNLSITNDELGHQAGDASLRKFSLILQEIFSHCPVFRTGGNEFIAVFLNMEEKEIENKLSMLELAIEQESKSTVVQNNVIFGTAFLDDDKLTDTDKVLSEAIKAMGQNRRDKKQAE